MNIISYSLWLAVALVNCEDDPERFLKGFKLNAAKNVGCYQIYNSTDQVDDSTCQKPHTEEKRSCALELEDDKHHCEIITPSDESIIVPCHEQYSDPDSEYYGITFFRHHNITCYMVRKGLEVQKVCPKLVANHTAVITTPDNYTLIVRTKNCYSGKWLSTILADEQFASDFTFDPDERSCYKIFRPDQDISYLTCFEGIESPKVCVHYWNKNPNCTVLTTPNNETIIIDCKGGTNTNESCLEIHKDGISSEVCMEELEEGCMGITTPSGLRILFACRICRDQTHDELLHRYDKAKLKSQRQFVKNFLEHGEYYKHKYEVWNNEYSFVSKSRQSIYPHWLPNTTCYGLKLDTNETVVFQCTDRKFEPQGCFKIIDPDEEGESDICATINEETCIIIDTPKGQRVFLECYNELEYIQKTYLDTKMAEYQKGKYVFEGDNNYMYRLGPNCKQEKSYGGFGRDNTNRCFVIVTKDLERVELECPNHKENNTAGCFKIYSQKYGADGQIIPFSYTEDEACAKIVNNECLGITTPKGWILSLTCYAEPKNSGGVFKVKPKEPTDQF